MLQIEGETFDGLYMYYQDRYLYSWDTPYEQYVNTGYNAKERPWYKNAIKEKGKIVFTPPYMSYANHYVLSTIHNFKVMEKPSLPMILKWEIFKRLFIL